MDKTAPGGVYLCRVNENLSCGACCGLYNVPDLSRYFFKDSQYAGKAVDYAGINPDSIPSLFYTIFREFGSCFKSDEEIRKAEMMIESLWERLQKGA